MVTAHEVKLPYEPKEPFVPRILIVENVEAERTALAALLRQDGHTVTEASGAMEALVAVNAGAFDLVFTGQVLPDGKGLEVLEVCQETDPLAAVVILTAFATVELAIEALRLGAFDFLTKPFTPQGVRAVVSRAVERAGLRRENSMLRNEVERLGFTTEFLVNGPAMQQVKQRIALVAPTNATVLISGETGTGKELVARAIHKQSARSSKGFVAVNCAAFPDTLLDSELFGYEKGAFTGADRTRPGWFESADGGTLFLDEAGEMSLALQSKLLRVLTDRRIVRVGSRTPRSIDVRLIFATHMDLAAMMATGGFRQDLYYRIAVVPIDLPPLRQRREDIPKLAEQFLLLAQRDLKLPRRHISPPAMEKLCTYDFPGNIRELRNLIERACILAQSETIETADFPLHAGRETDSSADPITACVHALPPSLDLRETVDRLERELIARALNDARGVQAEAARRLNLSRGDIGYKLKRYAHGDLTPGTQ
jgi:two-component system response regulator HydG